VAVPTVPEGGLYVQQGATGPVAYGALRYRVTDGSSAILTLTTAPGSVALAASMQACKTSSSWTAPSPAPGPWEQRPTFGVPCSPGIASSDGAAVAFNLSASFVADGVLDVAIVPLSAATPFAVAFQPPGADALASNGGRPSVSPTLPTPTTVASSPLAGSSSPSGAPPIAAPSRSPVAGGTTASPTAPAPSPILPAARDDAGRSALANDVIAAVGFGDPDRGARAAALGGASLIVVGWWLLTSQPTRMPRLLGAMAGATADGQPAGPALRVGGVGRFARAREGTATRLR
jgi:hypothetical protein